MTLKETVEDLKKIKGNVRGDIILGTLSYIREKKGKEGLKAVKEKVREFGFSNSLEKIFPLEWLPEALSVAIILSAKEIFKWDDNDIFEMGNFSIRYSFVARTTIKYFVSLEKAFKEASKYWEKYFDFGNIEIKEKREKSIRVAVNDYRFHPDICKYHAGFMLKIAQLALGKEDISIKEVKCLFKGDSHHEYLISWK